MEAKAVEKYLSMSPRKVKYIIDMVKDKKVEEAMDILTFTHQASSRGSQEGYSKRFCKCNGKF